VKRDKAKMDLFFYLAAGNIGVAACAFISGMLAGNLKSILFFISAVTVIIFCAFDLARSTSKEIYEKVKKGWWP